MNKRKGLQSNISTRIGLILLIVGAFIFALWTLGMYKFANNVFELQVLGFWWMIFGFFAGISGLLGQFVVLVQSRREFSWRMMIPFIVILMNIPVLIFILDWQSEIEEHVFIKLTNQTGIQNSKFEITSAYTYLHLGGIENGGTKVFNYFPERTYISGRKHQLPDTLKLLVQNINKVDTIIFPQIRIGACKHFILGSGNKLLEVK